ncbi:MAG: DNA-binding protein YbaB/EbfC family [Actinomycetia bacterium]|nr:DNA-binding protein YbaB/EbfC family [Actinomycetes bacterium]
MANEQLNQMMQSVQKMQADMAAAQAALAEARVDGTAGGGMVRATVSGTGDLKSVSIHPSVVDPADVEMLEDLVVAAVADARRAANELQEQQLGSVTGGLDLGPLGGLLG